MQRHQRLRTNALNAKLFANCTPDTNDTGRRAEPKVIWVHQRVGARSAQVQPSSGKPATATASAPFPSPETAGDDGGHTWLRPLPLAA